MRLRITRHKGYAHIWPEEVIVSHLFEKPAARIARRFKQGVGVVQLKPKGPRVPSVLIHGRKYALSNYWPMLSDMSEPEEGGARVIDVGGAGRYSWLWVYDTDRKVLAMWRYSDGDDKFFDRASSHAHLIVTLEKKGHLNRVTHEEFKLVEREMGHRYDSALKALKEIAETNATDWDRQVKDILTKHFEDEIYPNIDRQLENLKKGVMPFGFRYNEHIPKSREEQMQTFVVTQVLSKFTQAMAYDLVSKETGFNAYEPPDGGDNQAVQWTWNDLVEATYEKYSL